MKPKKNESMRAVLTVDVLITKTQVKLKNPYVRKPRRPLFENRYTN
jgi:hypothetical protein